MSPYLAMAAVSAVCLTIALIVSRGPWNLGHSVADRLERLAVWVRRVTVSAEYAWMAFLWKQEQLKRDEGV